MSETINQRLKSIRERLHINQRDFAKTLEIKQGSLSDIERGRIGVSSKIVEKLTKKLNVNSGWLYDGKGDIFIGNNLPNIQGDNSGGNTGGKHSTSKSEWNPMEFYRAITRIFNEVEIENPEIKAVYDKIDELIDFIQFMNEMNRKYFSDLWFFALPSLYENSQPPNYNQIKEGIQERLKQIEPMMPAIEKLESAIQQFYKDFKAFDTKHIMEEHQKRETIFKR